MPMPVPSAPSRSLPQGRAADGSPVPLPPLPESQVPPTSLPGTSEPCATPQTQTRTAAKNDRDETAKSRSVDPASARAGYQAQAKAPLQPETAAGATWSLIKPYLFRFPLSQGVEIEIRASVVPSARP
jgi:hypothetical protein